MSEGGEALQPNQGSETERLTRRMRIKSTDGSEYRVALPSVVNNDAIQAALNRVGATNEGDTSIKLSPTGRALNTIYGLWEALGAKVEPLKPPEVPKGWEGKIEPGQK